MKIPLPTRYHFVNRKMVPTVQSQFRGLVEMLEERGLSMLCTTIVRWVQQYSPKLDEQVRHYLRSTDDS